MLKENKIQIKMGNKCVDNEYKLNIEMMACVTSVFRPTTFNSPLFCWKRVKRLQQKHALVIQINNIGLLHKYWWKLSRAEYHIARACECNMIYCEGQYSPIFMQ
jgi:hypothetical protein